MKKVKLKSMRPTECMLLTPNIGTVQPGEIIEVEEIYAESLCISGFDLVEDKPKAVKAKAVKEEDING